MADQTMHLVSTGSGAGLVETVEGWAPVLMFMCPLDDSGDSFGTVMVALPSASPRDLHYLAEVIKSMATGRELHLDREQMTAILDPLFAEHKREADQYGDTVAVLSGDAYAMGAEGARMAREGVVEPEPLPDVRCIVCGVRIFGDVAVRGACLTCDPPLGKGEVRL